MEIKKKQVERDYQIAGYRWTDLRLISRTKKVYAYLHVKMSDTAGKVILLFLFTCKLIIIIFIQVKGIKSNSNALD